MGKATGQTAWKRQEAGTGPRNDRAGPHCRPGRLDALTQGGGALRGGLRRVGRRLGSATDRLAVPAVPAGRLCGLREGLGGQVGHLAAPAGRNGAVRQLNNAVGLGDLGRLLDSPTGMSTAARVLGPVGMSAVTRLLDSPAGMSAAARLDDLAGRNRPVRLLNDLTGLSGVARLPDSPVGLSSPAGRLRDPGGLDGPLGLPDNPAVGLGGAAGLAGGPGGLGGLAWGAVGQAGGCGAFGEGLAAEEEGGCRGVAAQGTQGGEVVGGGAVPGAQDLLQEREVSGRGAGQSGAVPGEVGHQEGPQPGALAHRLVQGLGETVTVLYVLGRGGAGVKGEGESAAEHTQLLRTERHAAAGSVWRGHAATIRANRTN